MFISKRRLQSLERQLINAEDRIERANDRYWDLRHQFELLLGHLGVSIETIPTHLAIHKKGGPEQG
jgi:hypothetical protein